MKQAKKKLENCFILYKFIYAIFIYSFRLRLGGVEAEEDWGDCGGGRGPEDGCRGRGDGAPQLTIDRRTGNSSAHSHSCAHNQVHKLHARFRYYYRYIFLCQLEKNSTSIHIPCLPLLK